MTYKQLFLRTLVLTIWITLLIFLPNDSPIDVASTLIYFILILVPFVLVNFTYVVICGFLSSKMTRLIQHKKTRDIVISLFCAFLICLGAYIANYKSDSAIYRTWMDVNLFVFFEGFYLVSILVKFISLRSEKRQQSE